MEVDDIPQITPNIDYNSIQPIHQKRTIAFVNHFLLSTVAFLNDFACSCESRLMQFEYKLQKIEASLLILESQLSSIPDLNDITSKPTVVTVDLPEVTALESTQDQIYKTEPTAAQSGNTEGNEQNCEDAQVIDGNGQNIEIKASADGRFIHFFKMLHYGVPTEAVKLKMVAEGYDPQILDDPNAVIPG